MNGYLQLPGQLGAAPREPGRDWDGLLDSISYFERRSHLPGRAHRRWHDYRGSRLRRHSIFSGSDF